MSVRRAKTFGSSSCSCLEFVNVRLPNRWRLIQSDAQHRARRQLHVLPGRRGRDAAAADQDAGDRALPAAEDAADDRAHAGAGADLGRITLDALALDGSTTMPWIG